MHFAKGLIRRDILPFKQINQPFQWRLYTSKERIRKWIIPSVSTEMNQKKLPTGVTTGSSSRSVAPEGNGTKTSKRRSMEPWFMRKTFVKRKYPDGWSPSRKLSPAAMEGLRVLHRQRPQFTLVQLADFFKISPEAIRRILKSKWRPSPEEQAKRLGRWQRRRERIREAAKSQNWFTKRVNSAASKLS